MDQLLSAEEAVKLLRQLQVELLQMKNEMWTQAATVQHQVTMLQTELKEMKERLITLFDSRHATEDLAWLAASSSGSDLSAAEVTAKLECGADVCRYRCPSLSVGLSERVGCPILHTLVWRGCVEGVEAVMAHPTPVYLTAVDAAGHTPLHVVCDERVEVGAASRMLQAMVARAVDPRMRTELDLSQWHATRGLDFVNAAAVSGRLSVFWKLVKQMSYYADKPRGGITLTVAVRAEDWAQLSAEDHRAFTTFQQRERATASLNQILRSTYGDADLPAIRDAVEKGADVMAVRERSSILCATMCWKNIHIYEVLLSSPLPIDFTVSTSDGWTVFSSIAMQATVSGRADVSRLLQILVKRLHTHPEDKMDWRQKDKDGYDVISTAACWGALSAFVEVLYVWRDPPVPYFTDYKGKMPITCTVDLSDWKGVPEALRELFDLQMGLNQKF